MVSSTTEPSLPIRPGARRPLGLDAFRRTGGIAMRYRVAGFDIVGVEPQPHCPFKFVQAAPSLS
ncbi:hypothetical protein [Streptomyces sp. NPDC008139]|uniref:hypothetical protein n=1 Tax=Streptomyces sp. NPDC008139 TaxID=3364814 RepID=UPI0036E38E89